MPPLMSRFAGVVGQLGDGRELVVPGPPAGNDLIMGTLLCKIGVHRWVHKRNPEGGAQYLECERCQKQKDTITLGDNPGG